LKQQSEEIKRRSKRISIKRNRLHKHFQLKTIATLTEMALTQAEINQSIDSLNEVIDYSKHNEVVRRVTRNRKETNNAELEGMATIRDYRMSRMTGKFKDKHTSIRPVSTICFIYS
jgi:Asp-tRNA(Asn)/Glu-tRNA(Gln) amidotransferase C subunit